ncbi:MAG: hypothetical protein ACRDRA_19430 [Pseudonocardiaceae bacterium]
MDRIAIIGCGGSGKTIIGRHLAAVIDVPITHLDLLTVRAPQRQAPIGELQQPLAGR